MMKLVEQLIGVAADADQKMGKLADKEEKALARRQAYGRLESLFDQMAGDGQLSRQELDQLMKEFRAQGLDTATLDEVYKQLKSADGVVKVDPQLRNKIGEQLQEAKFSTRDPSLFFQAQDLMSTYHQSFDLASRVSKAEHEAYMTAIKHLVA
jgi:D-alanyl-D-alanine carboxypeptidase